MEQYCSTDVVLRLIKKMWDVVGCIKKNRHVIKVCKVAIEIFIYIKNALLYASDVNNNNNNSKYNHVFCLIWALLTFR